MRAWTMPLRRGRLTIARQSFVAKSHAAPTAVLLDPKGDLGHLYGAKTTPHMFVINPRGVLIYEGAIDDNPLQMWQT
jgi:hypothetical protein